MRNSQIAKLSLSRWILIALPVLSLLVPHGTIERDYVGEAILVSLIALSAGHFTIRLLMFPNKYPMRRTDIYPLPAIMLIYLCVINPVISLFRENDIESIVLTSVPFSILGLSYVYAFARLTEIEVGKVLNGFIYAAVLLSFGIIMNFILGDVSQSGMRSTSIVGRQTFVLPILPIGGVIAFEHFISARSQGVKIRQAVFFLLIAAGILATVTRAMFAAFVIGCVIILWWYLVNPSPALLGQRIIGRALVGAVGCALVALPFLETWISRVAAEDEGDVRTVLGRVDEITAYGDGFLDSPVFGQGIGHLFAFPSEYDLTLSLSGKAVSHNHVFFFLGATGITGALLYYGTLSGALIRGFRLLLTNRNNDSHASALLGIVAGMVTGFLFTLTSTTYTTVGYNIFLATALYASHLKWRAV